MLVAFLLLVHIQPGVVSLTVACWNDDFSIGIAMIMVMMMVMLCAQAGHTFHVKVTRDTPGPSTVLHSVLG